MERMDYRSEVGRDKEKISLYTSVPPMPLLTRIQTTRQINYQTNWPPLMFKPVSHAVVANQSSLTSRLVGLPCPTSGPDHQELATVSLMNALIAFGRSEFAQTIAMLGVNRTFPQSCVFHIHTLHSQLTLEMLRSAEKVISTRKCRHK